MHRLSAPRRRIPALLILFLLVFASHLPAAAPIDASTYPRAFKGAAGEVKVHHPVISDWKNFKRLTGRMPVEISSSGGEQWIGSLFFEVDTVVHFDERLVSLHDVKASQWSFDGAEPSSRIHHSARKQRPCIRALFVADRNASGGCWDDRDPGCAAA